MNLKYTRAFTLLEIVIAMLILSLIVAGMFGLFVTSSKFIIEAQHRLQAASYAKAVAEHLKVYISASPNVPAGAGQILDPADNPHDPETELNIPLPPGVANCEYTVTDNVQGTDMKKVTITVTCKS